MPSKKSAKPRRKRAAPAPTGPYQRAPVPSVNGHAPPPPPPQAEGLPTRICDLRAKPRRWLWQGYVPRGAVTVVTGPQSAGKTAFLCWAAAQLTQKAPTARPQLEDRAGVLWYTTEDDPSTMLTPRLDAQGCDLAAIHVPDYEGEGRLRRRSCLPTDAQAIGDLAWRCSAGAVVFDPLTSFLATGFSPNDSLQVRAVLDSLAVMAGEHDLAVLVALHPRKGRSGDPLEWVSGSAAWTQAARQVLLLHGHPDRPETYFLSVLKRCSSEPAPTWTYRLPLVDGVPVFELCEQVNLDPRELAARGDLGEECERHDALEWLRAELAEDRDARVLYQLWTAQGFGRNLWWRCRKKLGVRVRREGQHPEQRTLLYLDRPAQ